MIKKTAWKSEERHFRWIAISITTTRCVNQQASERLPCHFYAEWMAVGHHMLGRKFQQLLLAQMCGQILSSWGLILAEVNAKFSEDWNSKYSGWIWGPLLLTGIWQWPLYISCFFFMWCGLWSFHAFIVMYRNFTLCSCAQFLFYSQAVNKLSHWNMAVKDEYIKPVIYLCCLLLLWILQSIIY